MSGTRRLQSVGLVSEDGEGPTGVIVKKLATIAVLGLSCIFACATASAQALVPQESSSRTISNQDLDLLRQDLRAKRKQLIAANLKLTETEAAKFWPIYNEYDAELTKLNDLRLANIQEYARNYDSMTESKADELIQKAFDYRKRRSELLSKYYVRVKESLGSVQAARFVQIEDQLLMIIDLQITSELPVVEGS